MIADVGPIHRPPDEPPDRVVENRHPLGTGAPRAAFELLDLVAGLATEQHSQGTVALRQHVHRQILGLACHLQGVTALGQTHQKLWRLIGDLTAKADQATRWDTFGLGCHHQRRAVQHRHKVVKRFIDHTDMMDPRDVLCQCVSSDQSASSLGTTNMSTNAPLRHTVISMRRAMASSTISC